MFTTRTLPTILAGLLIAAAPASTQERQDSDFLAGLEDGEAVAEEAPTSSGWLFGILLGAGTGYMSEWETTGEALGAAAGLGLVTSLFSYYAGTKHLEPPEEWADANASEPREYREGFRRGYRERMRERQLSDAALFGIAATLTYTVVAMNRVTSPEESSGLVCQNNVCTPASRITIFRIVF